MPKTEEEWAQLRAHKISNERPREWPQNVDAISLGGLSLLGIHRKTNELYWDGDKLVTEKRFSNFERWLAGLGLLIAAIGVAATVVQAWAAVAALPV